MKLSATMNQDLAELEKAKCKPVSPMLAKLCAAVADAGDYFNDLGVKDASSGRAQRTEETFIAWGRKELGNAEGENKPIVDLMYMCYQEGYNAEKEAHHV